MDKKDNFIIIYPTPQANNNLNRDSSHNRNRKNDSTKHGDEIYYRDIMLEKLAEEIMKIELNKARLAELEKKLEQLGRSQIVTAPLQQNTILTNVKKVNINDLDRNATKLRAVQAYTNIARQLPAKQEVNNNNNIIPKEEKISLWQRIKKAVKSFFSEEKENKENDIQLNNVDKSLKYNQFRQSISKTTVKIDVKNRDNVNVKEPKHILDRYA